ncbi:MAG: tetratricopeptide repeat protein [Candidatus Omnitrophica bacterium]|nr:tetratricopeptide repeat protein [Candidatus Omnitrophota bacterium]
MKPKEWINKIFQTNKGCILILVLLGLFIYIWSLPNEMFWDDDDFILKNRYIKEWQYFPQYFSQNLVAGASLNSNYWRPLLLIVFASEWSLWKDWPPGWHSVNTAFHLADSVLLFFILLTIFRNRTLAFCTSLIFLTHPIQVETVVYVNSLGDSLSVFFMFTSILLYLKFRLSNTNASLSPYYYIALATYPLALLSKESGILLPAFIGICDFMLLDPKKTFLRRMIIIGRTIWPFALMALFYIYLRATKLNFINTFNFYDENTEFTSNFWLRLINFFQVLQIYFGLIFVPYDLRVERILEVPKTFFQPAVMFGSLVFSGMVSCAAYYWKRKPTITFGILWFFIGLILTSNLFVAINALVYEHFLYVPIIGIAVLLCWLVIHHLNSASLKNTILKAFILLLIVYCGLSIKRVFEWRTAIGFYENLIIHSPNSYRVINNLGMEYADKNIHDKAEKYYLKAIALDPKNPVAYHNIAGTYRDTGRTDLALQTFLKAVELDPKFIFSYKSIAQLYFLKKDYRNARAALEEYFNRSDEKASTLESLIYIADLEHDLPALQQYWQLAKAINPNDPAIQMKLNSIEQELNKTKRTQ